MIAAFSCKLRKFILDCSGEILSVFRDCLPFLLFPEPKTKGAASLFSEEVVVVVPNEVPEVATEVVVEIGVIDVDKVEGVDDGVGVENKPAEDEEPINSSDGTMDILEPSLGLFEGLSLLFETEAVS